MANSLDSAKQRGDAEAVCALFTVAILVIGLICWIAFGDSPAEAVVKAKAAVEDSGYSNVQVEPKPVILACDSNDVYRYRWKGTNVAGKEVHGQDCAGWFFKGWTVRLER